MRRRERNQIRATEMYRQILVNYPGTHAAKLATERLVMPTIIEKKVIMTPIMSETPVPAIMRQNKSRPKLSVPRR